jgi:hypothetical protein
MSQGHEAIMMKGQREYLVDFQSSMVIEQEMAR